MAKKKKITTTIPRSKETPFEATKRINTYKKIHDKIQIAPQTFIEDTFSIGVDSDIPPTIIKNEVKKKQKQIISADKLCDLFTFKNKLVKIKTRAEYEKSFAFLFDFVNSTKVYKTYHINEIDDEYDLLLQHSVIEFKKKMAILQLNYETYTKFEVYFGSLKTLYNRFKTYDNTEKVELNIELQKMIDMSEEIAYHYFK